MKPPEKPSANTLSAISPFNGYCLLSRLSRGFLILVLAIQIGMGSGGQASWAADDKGIATPESYEETVIKLEKAKKDYEQAERAFLEYWRKRLPPDEYAQLKKVAGTLLGLVFGGLTLYAAGLKLGLLSLASQLASATALDQLELSKEELQALGKARLAVLRYKNDLKEIEIEIKNFQLQMAKNKEVYERFMNDLPVISEEDTRDHLAGDFKVECYPQEITEEESSLCKAEVFKATGSEQVNTRVQWTYEPDYGPLSSNGMIRGEEVKKNSPTLPQEIKVTATYELLPEEGGGTWSESSKVLVVSKARPLIRMTFTATPSTINTGDQVTYSYTVTNPGSVSLDTIILTDNQCTPVRLVRGDQNGDNRLDQSEQWTYECLTTLTVDTKNTATVTGTSPSGVQVNASAIATVAVRTSPCPSPKVYIPYVKFLKKGVAIQELQRLNLLGGITEKHSSQYEAGVIIEQHPDEKDCVDPAVTKVDITVSLGPPEDTAGPFTAEFSCGSSFELSPNEVLYPKTCYVRASNFKTTRERVEVEVEYDRKMVEVTFDKQAEAPKIPHNEFLLIFRTKTTASPGTTPVSIIIKHGNETVRIPVTVAVLPPGREPSSGPGIRPPVEEATGSGGAYCVWRYKSFGDPPNCFNIVRAQCDNPKYSGKPKYELVGSNMTPDQSAALASQLSPYKGDAYGCHRKPPEDQNTAGGHSSDEGSGSDGETGTLTSSSGSESSGTGDDQGQDGGKEDDNLLGGFPEDPGDAPSEGEPLTPEQQKTVEGFEDNGPTGHLPPSDPDQMVSGDSDDTPPVDIAAVAQGERDKDEARNRDREGIQRDKTRQADEDQQAINEQNAQDRQTQETAAQEQVAQAQAQGQVLIDQANQNADPIMSDQDMTETIDKIQQEGEDKIQAIDDKIRQGLGGEGQGGRNTPQPLPPPPSMGTGPVDTAVVQCNTKYGSGGDNPGFFTIDFNGATGMAQFEYDMESIKDEMEVSAGGATFNTTCRSNGEKASITIPSPNTPVTVTVKPNCACKKPKCTGTIWSFTFYCPTSAGAPTTGSTHPGNATGGLLGQ